ncbi:MAG: 6-phosphofructokinase [Fusobacteriia bacterium 4572_74]|nr:MAG: 6-phosphofructokinase [Fusobacteriia bacterium 4572_74]
MNNIKKIGVLTSGGDAPGMNMAIRAVVNAGINAGLEVYGIYEGYKGLVEGNYKKLTMGELNEKIPYGGTTLYSARLPEFIDIEVRQKGVDNLKKAGIEAIVVIGGDGSYRGAKALSNMGIKCIGIPGTIDNDIVSTDYTIGFDTALNTAVEAIDRLRDTSNSHIRCNIVELMGRLCGDLTLHAGISTGCNIIITKETGFDKEKVIAKIKKLHDKGERYVTVAIAEKITDIHKLAKEVQVETGYKTNPIVLGHIQRGGSPSAADRVLASSMGVYAVKLILDGEEGRCVGIVNNKMTHYDINEALNLKKEINPLYKVIKELN